MLHSYVFVESTLVEAIRTLDIVCTISPQMVPKVYNSGIKKCFQILCDTNRQLSQQSNQPPQQYSSNVYGSPSASPSSPYSRRHSVSPAFSNSPYISLSSPASASRGQAQSPLLQKIKAVKSIQHEVAHLRSHAGCVFLSFFRFFLHHKNSLTYDASSIFSTIFVEQFPLCYQDSLFPIDMTLILLQDRHAIINDTNIFTEYYPQLLKMLAYMPHQIIKYVCYREILTNCEM